MYSINPLSEDNTLLKKMEIFIIFQDVIQVEVLEMQSALLEGQMALYTKDHYKSVVKVE